MNDDKKIVHLGDSELKVMEVVWQEGALPAKQIAVSLTKQFGWNKNTTYTLIKRCIAKGVLRRDEPDFFCTALVTKEEIQKMETKTLVDKLYNGAENKLFAALLGKEELSEKQLKKLKQIIDEW